MYDHTYLSTSVVLSLSLSPSCPLESCWLQTCSYSTTAHNTYHSPICVYVDVIEVRIIYPSILKHIALVNSLSLAFIASAYAATPNPTTSRVFNRKIMAPRRQVPYCCVICTLCRKRIRCKANLEVHYQSYHPAAFKGNTGSGDIIEQLGADVTIRSSKDYLPDNAANLICDWPRVPPGYIPADEPFLPTDATTEPPSKHDVPFYPARIVNYSTVVEGSEAGRVLGIAERLNDKHRKYGSDWNPWHPFANAFDYQQDRALST